MVYWISYYVFKIMMKVFFRGKCYERHNLPKKGPFIGIINHNSALDVPAMALVVSHRASTMVKHSLFDVPIVGWWLRQVDMFPVVRGGSDEDAFRQALERLAKGRVLYLAPEGTRKHGQGGVPKIHTGFVRLAQLADCPVVPIAIDGTREALPPDARFPRLTKVTAKVGKPIRLKPVEVSLENKPALEQQAREAMQEVYKLHEELQIIQKGK